MPLVSIKEILKNTLYKFKIDGSTRDVYEAWDKKISKYAKHAQVVSVQDDLIVVNVDNSVYLQELMLRKKEILNELNKGLKSKTIKDIRFKQGSID